MTAPPPEDAAPGTPDVAPVAPVAPVPASPAQLAWLEAQLPGWQADGLISGESAGRLRSRYVAHHKFSLIRLSLTLGAAFVGIGLIWLVAANLDNLSPLVRFLLFALLCLAFLVGGEVLAARRISEGDIAAPVVGAVRLLAAASYGAVVFQAAQSLQVPAYTPGLVGVWALGALVHGYLAHAVAPVVFGAPLGAFWLAWESMSGHESGWVLALAFLCAGVLAVAIGLHHEARWWPAVGLPWREFGAAFALIGLFTSAIPEFGIDRTASWLTWAVLGLAVALGAGALVFGARLARFEVGLALLALVLGGALAGWSAASSADVALPEAGGMGTLRSVVAVLVYLVIAVGYAVLGTLRDSWRIVAVAMAALVAFVTFQAFAIFAPILSGATLFLLVGGVLIVTGILADRGRRRIAASAKEALS